MNSINIETGILLFLTALAIAFTIAAIVKRSEKRTKMFCGSMAYLFGSISLVLWLVYTGNGWIIVKAISYKMGEMPIAPVIYFWTLVAVAFGIIASTSTDEDLGVKNPTKSTINAKAQGDRNKFKPSAA